MARMSIEEHASRILPFSLTGSVRKIIGLRAAVAGFPAPLGSVCAVSREHGTPIQGEVVGFEGDDSLILPYGDLSGVRLGNRVRLVRSVAAVNVGERLRGRVLDGLGRPLDGGPPPLLPHTVELLGKTVSPLNRPRINKPLGTGIRVVDGLLTCGLGQRLGIFAGSGVGKSTLLGQAARSSTADVNVVALIGERGREVREFLERDLGPAGLARSVVIVATSDEPALIRLRAAHFGTAIAEYFRDTGRDVLLMMDSVTRYALAQREIGLAVGEPPATRGYPPSVFAQLPRLLERSGRTESGSITGFYTVLVEADDTNEPISDAVRGILDGHIILSRRLAERAHWPAIDVLGSISRSMKDVVSPEHQAAADSIRKLMAAYQQSEEMISIGAYQSGSNPQVDLAIRLREAILNFLRQSADTKTSYDEALADLIKLSKLAANQASTKEARPTDGGARMSA